MIVLLVVGVVAAIAVVVVSAVVAGVSRDVVVVGAVLVGCQLATRPRLGTARRNTAGRPVPRPWHHTDISTLAQMQRAYTVIGGTVSELLAWRLMPQQAGGLPLLCYVQREPTPSPKERSVIFWRGG